MAVFGLATAIVFLLVAPTVVVFVTEALSPTRRPSRSGPSSASSRRRSDWPRSSSPRWGAPAPVALRTFRGLSLVTNPTE